MSTAEQVSRLRKATGLGWLQARMFLLGRSDDLCDRIIRAKETQTGSYLRDPIEDDPEFASRIEDARSKAQAALRAWIEKSNDDLRTKHLGHMVREHPLGSCHYEWKQMKKILNDEFGIKWFSPAEMNPGHHFD